MMPKKITFLLIAVILSFPAISLLCEIVPYVGIDGQLNRMRFNKGYGDNLFPKHYPQINVYGGLKYDNSFAVEAGYISEAVRNKNVTLHEGEQVLGAVIPPSLSPAVFKTYIKVRGYHLGFINTFCEPQWEHFRILWGAGIGFLRAEAERDGLSLGHPPIQGTKRHFKKDKAVLRLMLASEYQFHNKFGLRASLFFLQTSQMVIKAQPIAGRYTPTIRPKDSFVYSLGIFYEF